MVRLPFNLGIGGAVQTGFRYAWEGGYELAVRLDGDGQHDPAQLRELVARSPPARPTSRRLALHRQQGYRSSAARRVGIRVLARVVSWIAHERLTDTTSGFQALNRRTIALFAADLPHDYPEVEGLVMAIRHGIRVREVPVTMRAREHGRSSIGALGSVYYMIKVLLALFVDLFRRDAARLEDDMTPLRPRSPPPLVSVLLLLVVFELIRSRRLRERYALLWLATGLVLLALSAWRGGLNTIARWFGVSTYPPAVLFAVGLLFVILVLLHYSTVISKLSDQNTILAQRLALLESRIGEPDS